MWNNKICVHSYCVGIRLKKWGVIHHHEAAAIANDHEIEMKNCVNRFLQDKNELLKHTILPDLQMEAGIPTIG